MAVPLLKIPNDTTIVKITCQDHHYLTDITPTYVKEAAITIMAFTLSSAKKQAGRILENSINSLDTKWLQSALYQKINQPGTSGSESTSFDNNTKGAEKYMSQILNWLNLDLDYKAVLKHEMKILVLFKRVIGKKDLNSSQSL